MIIDFERRTRRTERPPSGKTEAVVAGVRDAQRAWARTPLRQRLRVMARTRHALARNARRIASEVRRGASRPIAETLSAEVLPLADACRFLEKEGRRILAPRKLGVARRPLWLAGSRVEIEREPLGVVLIIGPSNYPLLLPGVQCLQALTAGNGVVLKPGEGGAGPMCVLASWLIEAGLPPALLAVLPDSVEAAQEAIDSGVDKVVLTGSVETGRAVLSQLATRLTPATLELSGCDAVFVREDADLDLVTRAIAFGTTLRAGETCIAPRRIFAAASVASDIEKRLAGAFEAAPACAIDPRVARRLAAWVENALSQGARMVTGSVPIDTTASPILLADVKPEMEIMRADVFAPVVTLCAVDGDEEALELASRCPYALGATVFGRPAGARAFAERVRAGVVVLNDMIVPTADPRVPFGGRGASGFGVTRGLEGLLEMTAPKTIITRRGRGRPHLDPPAGGEERLFDAFIRTTHSGSWTARFVAARDLILAGRELSRSRKARRRQVQ